ncbi:MAG TPA: ribosome small subunit-dependent GTPase A, partial [Myxococcaceae bacterium]|nr:ribosome small subunit-dependent GTPase A [Myxococcaceae bacterium]
MEPGRVVRQDRALLRIQTETSSILAAPSGRLTASAPNAEALPVVGDWVAVTQGGAEDTRHILGILPRSSLLSRRAPGEADRPQPMAANVDL